MPIEQTSTAHAVWHHLRVLREDLLHKLADEPRDAGLYDRLAAVEGQLLEIEAPAIDGVLLKLSMLWATQLEGDHPEARHKRLILADLQRLAPPTGGNVAAVRQGGGATSRIIDEIEEATTEAERRQVLVNNAQRCPALLELPEYPDSESQATDMNIRDYLHFVAEVALLGRRHKVLLRYVYVAQCGASPDEGVEIDLIGSVGRLEMATHSWLGAPLRWDQANVGILSLEMGLVVDDLMLEHEQRKANKD